MRLSATSLFAALTLTVTANLVACGESSTDTLDRTDTATADTSESDAVTDVDAPDTDVTDTTESDTTESDTTESDTTESDTTTDPTDTGSADADTTDTADVLADADPEDVATDAVDPDATDSDATDPDTTDSDTDTSGDTAADVDPEEDADSDVSCGRAASSRGAWMYRHPGNALGTDVIVGVPAEETAAIANLNAADITRLYGNYGNRPISDANAIADWNASLAAEGIDSQLLLGEATHIFPGCQEDLLEEIQERFIDFNASRTNPDERFTALHLDVEPQQYKMGAAYPQTTSCGLRVPNWEYWDVLDTGDRARRYNMLLSTIEAVRTYLDDHGAAGTEVYIDLAPWVDSSASFDWSVVADVADGLDLVAQLAAQIEGITFMTYERDSAASIEGSVTAELTLSTEVRVSVSAKERDPLSSIETWTDLATMFAVVEEIETNNCGALPVDIFNYRYLHE